MKKQLFWIILIALLLSALLAVSCGSRQDLIDKSLLTGAPCAPPCWQGITPGQTSRAEALQILQNSPYIQPGSIQEAGAEDWGGALWRWKVGTSQRQPGISWQDGVVDGLTIGVNYQLTVEEVIAAFGPPEGVLVMQAGVPEHPYWGFTLYYPQRGIEFHADTKDYNTPFEPSTPVIAAELFSPTTLSDRVTREFKGTASSVLDAIREWNGYGEVQEKYAPPTFAPSSTPVDNAAASLASLAQVDDYPFYTMHYYGSYEVTFGQAAPRVASSGSPWACSLFAALGDPENMLYGRNFDWEYSPALLLFMAPPDGYASVSMVNLGFLGFTGDDVRSLLTLPPDRLQALLSAPGWPLDGMNEKGLAVAVAAVPPGDMPIDPAKETIDSLGIVREVLDHAATVDEAVALFQRYNVDMTGGPPLHYLVADRAGNAALVEYYQGQVAITRNDSPWLQATNFIRASVSNPAGQCWRYDRLSARLSESSGKLDPDGALALLDAVTQDITRWSAVYGLSTGEVRVVVGQEYGQVYTFEVGEE